MANTKLNFVSKLPSMEGKLGTPLMTALRDAAYQDDWDFVKELLAGYLSQGYDQEIDWLYSLIPGQEVISC